MTSLYAVTVDADNGKDAEDIARRRAREDGFTVVQLVRAFRSAPLAGRRWTVELAVERTAA